MTTVWPAGNCFWCGKRLYKMGACSFYGAVHPQQLTRDHVWPKYMRQYNPGTVGVVVPSCIECNWAKGDMIPEKFIEKIPEERREAAKKFLDRKCLMSNG